MLPKELMIPLVVIAVGIGASLGSLTWMITHHAPVLPLITALCACLILSVLAARIIQKAPKTAPNQAAY